MTAHSAIAESIATGQTVHLHGATEYVLLVLLAECDDNADNDYWGTDENGNTWRVIAD